MQATEMDVTPRRAAENDRPEIGGGAGIARLLAASDYRGAAGASYRLAIDSPTITSWGSIAARGLSFFVVLPLLLRHLSTAEIALWYVFASVTSIQLLITSPLTMTFARFIAYAIGGASVIEIGDLRVAGTARTGSPNVETLGAVWWTMRRFYGAMAIGALVLLGIGGTLALQRPVSLIEHAGPAWMAWLLVVAATSIFVWGERYSALLQGTERIAVMKRWEIATSAASIAAAALVLALGGGFLAVVAVTQLGVVANIVVNRTLCQKDAAFALFSLERPTEATEVLRTVRGVAWRSALGTFMAAGTQQLSNIAYAQLADPASLASYLLAFNLLSTVRLIAYAPFMAKIPRLARLRAAGDLVTQRRVAARGMALVYWSFVLGFAVIGFAGPFLLERIGSNTPFVPIQLWILLGIAFFLERFGSVHLHLYTTTNHVIWHIVTGVSGAIFVVAAPLLYPLIGVNAIPVALIIAYLGFFIWYPARQSYRALGTTFSEFDRWIVIPPFAVFALVIATLWAIR